MRYCAYQERSSGDVKHKLNEWGLQDEESITWVLEKLKHEEFVDDQRFARIFANSKLNQNKWGKNKIKYALQAKSIPNTFINEALEQLPKEHYNSILQKLAEEKARETGLETQEQRAKLNRFLLQRGYENEEIRIVIKGLMKKI